MNLMPRPKPETPRKKLLTVLLSEEEHTWLRHMAFREATDVSTFLRRMIARDATEARDRGEDIEKIIRTMRRSNALPSPFRMAGTKFGHIYNRKTGT